MNLRDLIKEQVIHAAKHGDADDILALREYYPELGEVLMVVYSAILHRDTAQEDLANAQKMIEELREQLQEANRRLTLLEEELSGLKYG